jgi:DNA-binding transcriptional ArsR family regulator
VENIKKEANDNFDKIKVFSSEDDKLKVLGELLSNKSSRDIIKLLMNKEHYTNEIANKLDLRPNLVIHHLKKLEELGLLEIRNKRIVKKGNEHRYFKINPSWFITPNHTRDEIEEKGIFQKIFKEGLKFFVIGITTGSVFVLTDLRNFYNPDGISYASELPILVAPLTVLVTGLILERIFSLRKKRKN